jgi:3-methyladenine DNA glycosylase AlkD
MTLSAQDILDHLKSLANPENVAGMARFGISPENTYGISIPALRKIARQVGEDHDLAQELWDSGIHEARILACLIDEPAKVTGEQMDSWAADFDSWDVCDQCCGNLFNRTPFAYQKALEWSEHKQEFIKRAAFSLMACLAVHDKKAPDSQFEAFLPVLLRESGDERNYVKKAVNWALRQIGKRSRYLNERAIEIAEEMKRIDSKVTRWIASDALRELSSSKVQAKLLIRR